MSLDYTCVETDNAACNIARQHFGLYYIFALLDL